MIEQYEDAIEAFRKAPQPEPVAAISRACLAVAEHRAFEKFPAERDVARDYANALLQADRIEEARTVARAIAERLPDDATLWCNLSVTEILSNDLDAAEAALARSRKLDPDDKIASLLASRLAGYRSGKPVPQTIRELQRRS